MTTVDDCLLLELPRIEEREGSITPVEGEREVPFPIERVYYFYDIPGGGQRGGHAHRDLEQLVVAAIGSFDVVLDDGSTSRTVTLDRAYRGLYIPTMIWRELQDFTSGGIGVVLASTLYDEADYIWDYGEFCAEKTRTGA